MNTYKVTVYRLGVLNINASSEEAAMTQAAALPPEQIHWLGQEDGMPDFIVGFVERIEE